MGTGSGRWRIAALTAFVVLAAACGVDGDTAAPRPSDGGEIERVEADGPQPDAGPLTAQEVLEEMRGSVALVRTPVATGSSVLIEDGYLVTNAHVVDPYSHVTLVFEGDDPITEVPVVGVDLGRDIAVLGPVETDRKARQIFPGDDIEQGADLYLVGFPGQQHDAQVTIARGVLSRRRQLSDWGIDLIQSDATIGSGQSGGALVDERGRVVAISGMRDENSFALSLAGGDVMESVDRILNDEGSRWMSVPTQGELTEVDLVVKFPGSLDVFHIPGSDDDRRIRVVVDRTDALVGLIEVDGWAIDGNQAFVDQLDGAGMATFSGTGPALSGYLDSGVPAADDGSWSFDLVPGLDHYLVVGTMGTGDRLKLEVSEPMTHLPYAFAPKTIEVGATRVGVVASLAGTERVLVELKAGERVEIVARSSFGDIAFDVLPPQVVDGTSDDWDLIESDDDSGGGAFGLDARLVYEASADGEHAIDVYNFDGLSTEYRLEVNPTD